MAQGLGEGRRKPRRLLLPTEAEESTSQRLKKTTGEAPLDANNLPTKRAARGGGSVLGPWALANRLAEWWAHLAAGAGMFWLFFWASRPSEHGWRA